MASEFGRGAQVLLDGDGLRYARGAMQKKIIDNIIGKVAAEVAGDNASGYTPDGSTVTGIAADDDIQTPGGVLVLPTGTAPTYLAGMAIAAHRLVS